MDKTSWTYSTMRANNGIMSGCGWTEGESEESEEIQRAGGHEEGQGHQRPDLSDNSRNILAIK